MYIKHTSICMYRLCSSVCVFLQHCHRARQAGCVVRWQSRALYVCVCIFLCEPVCLPARVCGAGVPGRPAQLAAHLCSRLCAACAHALPTARHYGKKTQERGIPSDEERDRKKDGGMGKNEGRRNAPSGRRGLRQGYYKAGHFLQVCKRGEKGFGESN